MEREWEKSELTYQSCWPGKHGPAAVVGLAAAGGRCPRHHRGNSAVVADLSTNQRVEGGENQMGQKTHRRDEVHVRDTMEIRVKTKQKQFMLNAGKYRKT